MKLTLGILAGISIAWATAAIYRPAIRWAFNDQPVTPTGHAPKFRTWAGGVMTEGPWA